MLVYRVFPYRKAAKVGQSGHPTYLYPRQGSGRLDNPAHYLCWYLSRDVAGAVGESFSNWASWSEEMFEFPAEPDHRRALVTFEVDDAIALLDLDDTAVLAERGLRPTQVIRRNRAVTQSWALRVFQETGSGGEPLWNGVKWWSYHNPNWDVIGAWNLAPEVVALEALTIEHPAVVSAARSLGRPVA